MNYDEIIVPVLELCIGRWKHQNSRVWAQRAFRLEPDPMRPADREDVFDFSLQLAHDLELQNPEVSIEVYARANPYYLPSVIYHLLMRKQSAKIFFRVFNISYADGGFKTEFQSRFSRKIAAHYLKRSKPCPDTQRR